MTMTAAMIVARGAVVTVTVNVTVLRTMDAVQQYANVS